jgi:hypothetical protein
MVAALLQVACSSIECPVQNTVLSVYQLADTLHDTLYISSSRIDGTDTLLWNRGINLTTFKLPMSCQSPTDTLVFRTTRLPALDTVWVNKMDVPHFESVDCSAAYFHVITSVFCTHVGIDSIVLNHSLVDYDPTNIHFRIYFKDRP